MVKKLMIRFDTTHERDRRTDRQTPHDDIGRACIASRGKKSRFLLDSHWELQFQTWKSSKSEENDPPPLLEGWL